jgi:hypothetical protein
LAYFDVRFLTCSAAWPLSILQATFSSERDLNHDEELQFLR